MKLGIMQPYFFPYTGYFDLINSVDRWIVFDNVQHIRRGWVNRNRILHPARGWQYVVAPVKQHSRATPICEIEVVGGSAWKDRVVGQLAHYKKQAPFYAETVNLVVSSLASAETRLSRLNVRILDEICLRLGIPFRYSFFSEMNIDVGHIRSGGDWALRISQALGASEYVNPPGGADLYDAAAFAAAGVRLRIKNLIDFDYECGEYTFVPHLSIIDVLMWNSPASIKDRLDALR